MIEGHLLHDETYLRLLRLLESSPTISQRRLAETLGVSLGKTNFCLNALLDKGLVKMENFRTSSRKLNYAYLLTPSGLAEKSVLVKRFLKRKMDEYEVLTAEIELLKNEASDS
jgi:EPS-associated MarR family transcriptional regulator